MEGKVVASALALVRFRRLVPQLRQGVPLDKSEGSVKGELLLAVR
jgi:hypothetical protein